MSISPSDTKNKLQLSPSEQERNATGHKRALSSNFSQGDDLRTTRSSRSPTSTKLKLTNQSHSPSINYTTTGNSGLTINSAYGLNCKRLSNSSSSAIIDYENNTTTTTSSVPLNSSSEMVLSDIAQQRPHDRRLSNEELIDVMEKEQDAIVLRLMREISSLKEENMSLKQQLLNGNGALSRTQSRSSLSSNSLRFNSNYTVDDNYTRCKRPLLPTPRNSSTSRASTSTEPYNNVVQPVFSQRTFKAISKD